MAEQTSSSPKRRRVRIVFLPVSRASRDKDDRHVDDPAPSWTLEMIEGAGHRIGTWEVWNANDVTMRESNRLVAIERDLAALNAEHEQYVARRREQINIVVPDLLDEYFDLLSHRQLLAIITRSNQEPGETRDEAKERKADVVNPPAGERGSDSSSRSPLASIAGAIPS